MPPLPERYRLAFEKFGQTEIDIGESGIELFPLAELPRHQVGYSVDPQGNSLCDGELGSWKPSWIVIGRDTALGDPIFLDTADPDLHILTDMHGQDEWCPYPIATNIEAFFATLEELSQAGYQQDWPAMFARVARINDNPEVVAFWETFFDTGASSTGS
jgi:hypothetical protein